MRSRADFICLSASGQRPFLAARTNIFEEGINDRAVRNIRRLEKIFIKMNKAFLVISYAVCLIGISAWAIAQNNSLNPTGSVGIGTSAPIDTLHVQVHASDTGIYLDDGGSNYNPHIIISRAGSGRLIINAFSLIGTVNGIGNGLALGGNTNTQHLFISPGGNVGIGTTTPWSKLDAAGTIRATDGSTPSTGVGTEIFYDTGTYFGGGAAGVIQAVDRSVGVMKNMTIAGLNDLFFTNGSERMRIDSAGNVGIGTTAPTQKLSVNGSIRAKEVIVDTGWADYVFADNYKLKPLAEVEEQIKAEKHLPGIPSASEVAEKGISVGEMKAKLLAKIEELTLHQIEQEKRIEKIERENNALRHGAKFFDEL
jgi:hypothetical protein